MEFGSPQIITKCLNCTCMSKAFRQLKPEQLGMIDLHRSEIGYKKGQILVKQGSFISNMMFLKEGMVKIYLENGDKPPTMLSLEKCGLFIGLPFILNKSGLYNYTVEAVTDTEVCLVDLEVFRSLINQNAAFARELLIMSNQELMKSYRHTFSLTQKQITGRFAEFILYLKDEIHHKDAFDLQLSKREVAEMIATTQESLSRLIKQFKEDAFIKLDKQHLTILDEDKLRYLSKVA